MKYLPLSISLQGRHCLVVGGGKVAERKILVLLSAGATVLLVSPRATKKLTMLANNFLITWRKGPFDLSDIVLKSEQLDSKSPFLIIAATDKSDINAEIAGIANTLQIHVNVADDENLSNFFIPSLIEKGPVTVAVSTGGSSPMLARILSKNISAFIPHNIGKLAEFAQKHRERLKNNVFEIDDRKRFWDQVINGKIAELVLAGRKEKAAKAINTMIDEYSEQKEQQGEVYLVGAGPGDPELLTLKALRLMQKASIILYDRLVSNEILELCNADAEKIYVGKRKADHSIPQEMLNHMLARLAYEGHRVCRLKGGDPFIFGRGGEEINKLALANINFQVVPGITAASGCASYAGIPLTHRDHAQSVTFITGHSAKEELDWSLLCNTNQTLVIYMGLDKLESITSQLITHGLAADTPAALVEQGTTRNQRVHIETVANLLNSVKRANVKAPTIIIIGTVVTLHHQLEWYEEKAHKPTSIFSSGSEEEESNGKRIR